MKRHNPQERCMITVTQHSNELVQQQEHKVVHCGMMWGHGARLSKWESKLENLVREWSLRFTCAWKKYPSALIFKALTWLVGGYNEATSPSNNRDTIMVFWDQKLSLSLLIWFIFWQNFWCVLQDLILTLHEVYLMVLICLMLFIC